MSAIGQTRSSLLYDSGRRSGRAVEELDAAWSYRDLLLQLIGRDIKIRYKRSVLGIVWTMLNPLMMMVVLTLVFSHLFRFELAHYPVYLLSGTLIWTFIAQGSTGAMSQLQWGSSLLAKIYLPRTIFALSAIGTQAVNLVIATVPLLALTVLLGIPVTPALLWLPVPMVLAAAFALGTGLLLSSVAVAFRDVIDMYQIVLSAWYFLTPVMYPRSILPPEYNWLVDLNPVYYLVESFRYPIYLGSAPPLEMLVPAALASLVSLAAGWVLFSARADEIAYRL